MAKLTIHEVQKWFCTAIFYAVDAAYEVLSQPGGPKNNAVVRYDVFAGKNGRPEYKAGTEKIVRYEEGAETWRQAAHWAMDAVDAEILSVPNPPAKKAAPAVAAPSGKRRSIASI